jgi:deoxyribodipyrimidine photo-lyase
VSDRARAAVVWFRQDLRLADNPALRAALDAGGPLIPLYIDSREEEGEWAPGGAARWWLHQSLAALAADLARRGSRLVIRSGPALPVLQELCRASGADAVYWNRRYEPLVRARDARVKEALRAQGLVAESRNGGLLVEPWQVATQGGGPYRVYTPFRRRVLAAIAPSEPLLAPASLPAPAAWPQSLALAQLGLMPATGWCAPLAAAWQPGEAAATQRLAQFVAGSMASYADRRDLPGSAATSRLSPHLHHGELSPRQVWHAVLRAAAQEGLAAAEATGSKFLAELLWREFSYHLLHHFPHTPTAPLQEAFARFPWREAPQMLTAWQRGRSGVPLVDAGMRELWSTGWMHNRVRMVVASFLVKNLRLPWLAGAHWFWDTLVDADLASNTQGWQWVAGCGADAAPYYRVFNPVTQSRRHDPQGRYLRRWLPELARLGDLDIHAPWLATATDLAAAGVQLGRDYPLPIVDLRESRAAALAAWQDMRG